MTQVCNAWLAQCQTLWLLFRSSAHCPLVSTNLVEEAPVFEKAEWLGVETVTSETPQLLPGTPTGNLCLYRYPSYTKAILCMYK